MNAYKKCNKGTKQQRCEKKVRDGDVQQSTKIRRHATHSLQNKISAGEQVTILTTYPHPYLGLNYPVIITLNNMNNSTTKINHQNKHFTVLPIYV